MGKKKPLVGASRVKWAGNGSLKDVIANGMKQNAPKLDASSLSLQQQIEPNIRIHMPLIIIEYPNIQIMKAALNRLAAFYEHATHARKYLTNVEAAAAKVCEDYEAYNMPLTDVLIPWLQSMMLSINESADDQAAVRQDPNWWQEECNEHEIWLIQSFIQLGLLDISANGITMLTDKHDDDDVASSPYLVAYKKGDQLALKHEIQHAYFHISTKLSMACRQLWDELPKKLRAVIELELTQRKYAKSVWVDEFQAYVRTTHGRDFGKKVERELDPDVWNTINSICEEIEAKYNLKNI